MHSIDPMVQLQLLVHLQIGGLTHPTLVPMGPHISFFLWDYEEHNKQEYFYIVSSLDRNKCS